MLNDFRFMTVKKYLEKKNDPEILEIFNQLADAAIIFTPLVFGAHFLPIWGLLAVKDKLVNIGKSIVMFVSKQTEDTYVERAEQIKIAYSVICFTAYFEALNELQPDDFIQEIQKIYKLQTNELKYETREIDVVYGIPLADEILSYSEVKKKIMAIYLETSKHLIENLHKLDYFKKNEKKKDPKVKKAIDAIKNVPKRALQIYEAQYIDLGSSFQDFGFYMQFREFNALNKKKIENEIVIKQILGRIDRIDVGLTDLADLLTNIAEVRDRDKESAEIVEEIQKKYRAEVEKPIIDDNENEKELITIDEKTKLIFPRVIDAFIPQAYKCLTYHIDRKIKKARQQIEPNSVWEGIPVGEDIASFFVKYMSSPTSIDYPLLIIGHPGSGKSVLTKILSTQLMCEAYTVIRIPLREVNTDLEIVNIVEEQIKKDSQCTLSGGYAAFARHFKNKPLLIILDGYDELLQVKGQVFSGYLKKIHTFQQDQKDRERPVRIIVTSRITLIDKAIIPENSSILRLLEFDKKRQNKWVDIWNQTNKLYFKEDSNILPFSLPDEKEKNSIIELAKQPLLLLMLAIYDSDNNGLKELGDDLKKTELYDNLLQRFVRREVSRRDDFRKKTIIEQHDEITKEMKRLGVAAMGMFNRQKLHIHSSELEADLKTYNVHRSREQLKDADSLFGSFFFIHKSTTQDISNDNQETENAFEFLHNTFGEFLTADMIIKCLLKRVSTLVSLNQNPTLQEEYLRKLNDPNSLDNEWYLNIMFTPLYSRPVILEMIREHFPKTLKYYESNMDEEVFYEYLNILIQTQINFFLSSRQLPNVFFNEEGKFNKAPTMSFIATYTMNLVTLSSLIMNNGFIFNEANYNNSNSNMAELGAWDKLISLWKAWFPLDTLAGLSAILKSKRKDNIITIRCNDIFEMSNVKNKVELLLSVSTSLSDDYLTVLSGLQTSRFCDITKQNEDEALEYIKKVDSNFFVVFVTNKIRYEINNINIKRLNFKKINKYINILVQYEDLPKLSRTVLVYVFDTIEIALIRKAVYIETQSILISFIIKIIKDDVITESTSALTNIKKMIYQNLENSLFFFEAECSYFRTIDPIVMRERDYEYYHKDLMLHRMFYHKRIISRHMIHGHTDFYFIDEIFFRYLNENNLKEMLKTNPNHVAKLIYIHRTNFIDYNKTVLDYFDIFPMLFSQNAHLIGSDAIYYSIAIAESTKNPKTIKYADELKKYVLNHLTPRFLLFLFVANPKLLNLILKNIPEIKNNENVKILHKFSRELLLERSVFYRFSNELLEGNLEKKVFLFDIISIISYIEMHRNLSFPRIESIDRLFLTLYKEVNAQDIQDKISELSVFEYKTLLWYSEKTTNNEIIHNLRKLLTFST